MKTIRSTTKKVVATAAALLLFSAAQAQAGSVTLTGAIELIDDADLTHVTLDTPVTLQLAWANDALVSAKGGSTVQFRSDWGNTMTLTVGGLTLKETPVFSGPAPYAHFTDGVLDGFEMNKYDASLVGVSGRGWAVYASGFLAQDDENIFWYIYDESSSSGDAFEGFLNFPAQPASAVPVPGAVWLLASGLIGLGGMRRKVQ